MKRLAVLALSSIVLAGCAARKPPVCHPCFWEYEPAALKTELVRNDLGRPRLQLAPAIAKDSMGLTLFGAM